VHSSLGSRSSLPDLVRVGEQRAVVPAAARGLRRVGGAVVGGACPVGTAAGGAWLVYRRGRRTGKPRLDGGGQPGP